MKTTYNIAQYALRILAATWRLNSTQPLPPSPCIIAFWHGSMLPVWKMFAKTNANAIVSQSKDGDILAHLLTKWGFHLLRGSSSNKGKEIINEAVANSQPNYLLITPDGPRGPRGKCKAGAFVIAKKKQVPLYFINCNVTKSKIFNKSWDKFELPAPLTKININISKPIHIPPNCNKDTITQWMNFCNENF